MAREAVDQTKRQEDCRTMNSCACSCIFSRLSGESFAQPAQIIQRFNCPKGQVVFQQGMPIEGTYILCRGAVKLAVRARNGKKTLLRFYSPGNLIGIALPNGSKKHRTYAEAVDDSRIGFIDKGAFFGLLRRNPQLYQGLVHTFSNELDLLRERIVDISTWIREAADGVNWLPSRRDAILQGINI